MKRCRTIALVLVLLMILCGTADANSKVKVEVWGRNKIKLSASLFTWAIELFPMLRNTWLGSVMGITVLMPEGEEIGFYLNGSSLDERLKSRSIYDTAGLVFFDLQMSDFEPGEYAVKVLVEEPDGNDLKREITMDLGGQPDNQDELSVNYISNCEEPGTYKFQFYIDGELEKSFEWEW